MTASHVRGNLATLGSSHLLHIARSRDRRSKVKTANVSWALRAEDGKCHRSRPIYIVVSHQKPKQMLDSQDGAERFIWTANLRDHVRVLLILYKEGSKLFFPLKNTLEPYL
jgi:hypothetical protein